MNNFIIEEISSSFCNKEKLSEDMAKKHIEFIPSGFLSSIDFLQFQIILNGIKQFSQISFNLNIKLGYQK